MKRMMVRYKVKADRAAENESYIARVFEQLERDRPAGLRYATFKLEDGVSFVYLVSLETGDGSDSLRELLEIKEFTVGHQFRRGGTHAGVNLSRVVYLGHSGH